MPINSQATPEFAPAVPPSAPECFDIGVPSAVFRAMVSIRLELHGAVHRLGLKRRRRCVCEKTGPAHPNPQHASVTSEIIRLLQCVTSQVLCHCVVETRILTLCRA